MKTGALAARYAQALFAAAEEQGQTEQIYEQLETVWREMENEESFAGFIRDLSIPAPRKKQFMSEVFGGIFHPLVINFFAIIFNKNRESCIGQIIAAYRELRQEKQGIIPAELTTAAPVDDQQVAALAAALSRAYQRQVDFTRDIDPSLLGGAIVRIGDLMIDGSLKRQLAAMREELLK